MSKAKHLRDSSCTQQVGAGGAGRAQYGNGFDSRGSDIEMQQPIMQLMQLHKQMSGSKPQQLHKYTNRFSNVS